jgi:hypothetical protein
MRTILAIVMAIALLSLGGVASTSHAFQGQIVANDSGGSGAGS